MHGGDRARHSRRFGPRRGEPTSHPRHYAGPQGGRESLHVRGRVLVFSILILTFNEEANLPGCLESIRWCTDVVVLDSGSSDRTVEIARAAGCRVFSRPFDDFAGQRNYGITQISYTHGWVFHLDADEHFTAALRRQCEAAVAANERSGYLVPSRMMLWGTWLRHAATYPVYQMRFHRLGELLFLQYGHGQREGDSVRGIGTLDEPYEHHSFGKGLSEWFARHNRYSSQEAAITIDGLRLPVPWRELFLGSAMARRRSLKALSFRLPGRALMKFLYLYVLRGGFLDGRAGLAYCLMHGVYEQMISLKVAETRRLCATAGPAAGNAILPSSSASQERRRGPP